MRGPGSREKASSSSETLLIVSSADDEKSAGVNIGQGFGASAGQGRFCVGIRVEYLTLPYRVELSTNVCLKVRRVYDYWEYRRKPLHFKNNQVWV